MTVVTPLARHVLDTLRPIPDYPKPGIVFQDITPVLADGKLFRDSHRRHGRSVP